MRMTSRVSNTGSLLSDARSIIVISLVVGLAIRLAVMPLTYEYDMYHWAVVVQNINSGNGLYELNGYFYTPVWGYILGSIDAFWNTFLSIDVFGQQFPGFLDVEALENMNHVATVTSPEFNYGIKLPLVVFDIAVGVLVYHCIKELTNDSRKSAFGFAIWFLCPIAIYMSSIQGMFDNISGFLTLLCIMLVLKRHYGFGGFVLCMGILLKLYPAFVLPVIVALLYSRAGGANRGFVRDLAELFAGGALAFIIVMLPTIMDGTFGYAFTFITDRSDGFSGASGMFWLLGIAIAAATMLYFTYVMAAKGREDTDRVFLRCALLALTGGIMANLGPQYPLVLLPLMCVYIAAIDRSYIVCWALIGFGCMLQALVLNNYSLLMSVTGFWNCFPFDSIVSGLESTEAYIFGTNSFRSIMNSVFSFVAIAGLLLAILFDLEEGLKRRMPTIGLALERIRSIGLGNGGAPRA